MAPILSNTALCAIVRDEKMNPAGGIADFVRSTLPYVEQGVIVDTGSKDGTRGILEELEGEFANLRVYDHRFDGYGPSRNASLRHAKMKRVLILDADERLTEDDFGKLAATVRKEEAWGYRFSFMDVYPDGSMADVTILDVLNPRLFTAMKGVHFRKPVFEELYIRDKHYAASAMRYVDAEVAIKHFSPDGEQEGCKHRDWYDRIDEMIRSDTAPSEVPSFRRWKALNPHRDAVLQRKR